MADRIVHRGPDDSGVWCDADAGLALGFRRLSIIDLSSAGHQPMASASGRYVVAYNGEIYNHLELRKELDAAGAAPAWRGHSDSETLLACIDAWGLERTLTACVGMFALALWDRAEHMLSLARDRLGEKPMYYGWQNGVLLFGSELKALVAHPAFERNIDRDAIALLLRHNYIPAPYSIWHGIGKLPAGSLLTLRAGQRDAIPKSYWSLHDVVEAGQSKPFHGSAAEAVTTLEQVLSQAVAGQMLADVPLGALLSGGVDSSTIVALMQAQSDRRVKTFSIGFDEKAFDESKHAAAVAQHLGTDHTELFMRANDVLEAVPRMPTMYDEPFADSSQLPTALVMSLARQHVTVALSGDGGDELFAGYNRYFIAPRIWNMLRVLPHPLRVGLGRMLTGMPAARWDHIGRPLARALRQAQFGDKAHKLGQRLLHVRSIDDLYVALVNEWDNAEQVVPGSRRLSTTISQRDAWPRLADPVARMMAVDTLTYLPDDILVKVDRAAMAVSLETRAPFLDHRVVEFAARLPVSMKIAQGQGKALLRSVLYRHVPQELIDRPKMGFGIPLDHWLRHELRDWAESLLSAEALTRGGYFDCSAVRAAWEQHLSGTRSFGYRLWSILMFQAWLAEQGGGAPQC
jgi:asparagine synthase (glutamine-hydrolysing)